MCASPYPSVVEVSPGLYAAADGSWISEVSPQVPVVKAKWFPLLDKESVQLLLSDSGGGAAQDVMDTFGISGETRDLFTQAWQIGAGISSVAGYYQWGKQILTAMGVLQPSVPAEFKLLKQIAAAVSELNNKIDAVFNLMVSQETAAIRGQLHTLQNKTRAFIASPKPAVREELRVALDAFHGQVTGGLLEANASLSYIAAPWSPKQYAKAPWQLDMWIWSPFEFAPLPTTGFDQLGVPTLNALPAGSLRWDHRAWIGLIAESAVALILAHTALDPAHRTSGVYRHTLAGIAAGLRATAARVQASIQVTRPLQLPKDAAHFFYGEAASGTLGAPKPGTWRIFADGWPVGAVDTVTGASVFEHWKPAEHGYPLLDTLRKVDRKAGAALPPWPWEVTAMKALQAANSARMAAWFKLSAASPAIALNALAAMFEDMATPPTKSETVRFDGPHWAGTRAPAGTATQEVGGILCEKKTFTAEFHHVQRTGTVAIDVQPALFRTGAHEIGYRFLLVSFPGWINASHTSLPSLLQALDIHELALPSGTIAIEVAAFDWLIAKPVALADNIAIAQQLFIVDEPPLAGLYFKIVTTAGLGQGSQPVLSAAAAADFALVEQALEEHKGSMRDTGDKRTLTIEYQRKDEDGRVTFTFSNKGGEANGILWLVVEEAIGAPPLPSSDYVIPTEPILRPALRMAMIGIEKYVPPAFFAHEKHCAETAGQALQPLLAQYAARGKPIPSPDPTRDGSFADYVRRVQRQKKAGSAMARHLGGADAPGSDQPSPGRADTSQ